MPSPRLNGDLGSGILLRYRELLDAGAKSLEPSPERILRERGKLIDRLAEDLVHRRILNTEEVWQHRLK